MASSSSQHQQSNNRREHAGVLKPQQENKDSEHLRTKSHKTSTQLSKKDVENQDPNEAKSTKGGSKMLGVSRLPVLAKSLHSAVPGTSDKTGHQRWEERPLLGKVQKSKKCTKPVPFNFSQSRIHKQKSAEAPSETSTNSGITLTHLTQQLTINTPNKHRLQTHGKQSKNISVGLKSHTFAESKLKHSNADEDLLSYKVTASVQRDLSTQPDSDGANNKGRIQTLVSARLITENSVPFSPDPSALSSIQGVNSGGTLGATPRVSICPSGRGTSIYSAQRVPIKRPQKHPAAAAVTRPAGAESFSPDPSALRSILLNEGFKAGALTTPRCSVAPSGRKTSIYSAQKVPVKKAQTEAATLVGTVPFSPDPGALRSILLNEGIKVGGPTGTTPRVSVCPTGRGTLIYSAQRVPVRKPRAEEAGRTGQTPSLKGTPRRVPLPQSARTLVSRHEIPLVSESPGFGKSQAHSTDVSVKPEEDVVQRLFQEEQECENEQMQKAGKETSTCHSLQQHQQTEAGLRLEDESGRSRLEERKRPTAQPFIQAPHRQSVIVFSSGARAQMPQDTGHAPPCVAQSTDSAPPGQIVGSQGGVKSDSNEVAPPGGSCKTKGLAAASSLSSAASVLRRRTPLEELFLDDECATYTSRQPSWPAQPRCINPVASLLLFQDSTCFVPISWTSSSFSPGSHLASPIKA